MRESSRRMKEKGERRVNMKMKGNRKGKGREFTWKQERSQETLNVGLLLQNPKTTQLNQTTEQRLHGFYWNQSLQSLLSKSFQSNMRISEMKNMNEEGSESTA